MFSVQKQQGIHGHMSDRRTEQPVAWIWSRWETSMGLGAAAVPWIPWPTGGAHRNSVKLSFSSFPIAPTKHKMEPFHPSNLTQSWNHPIPKTRDGFIPSNFTLQPNDTLQSCQSLCNFNWNMYILLFVRIWKWYVYSTLVLLYRYYKICDVCCCHFFFISHSRSNLIDCVTFLLC